MVHMLTASGVACFSIAAVAVVVQSWTMKKFVLLQLQPQTKRSNKFETTWPSLAKPSEPLRQLWKCALLICVFG